MSDELRYSLFVFLIVFLVYKVFVIYWRGKPDAFDQGIAKGSVSRYISQKPAARKRILRPPSDEDIRCAEKKRAELILEARNEGFPDGLFRAARDQRYGPSWRLVDKVQPAEIFPDMKESELKKAAMEVNLLMQNNFGGGLVAGHISHAEALISLEAAVPGFRSETYERALAYSCLASR